MSEPTRPRTPAAPYARWRHVARNLSAAALVAALLLSAVALGACTPVSQYTYVTCGQRRLQQSERYYEEAKEKLAKHFELRVDTALSDAYHDSQNSVLLARATRSCDDFDESIRRQAINLIKTNLIFQKLVVSNMRDQDPGVVIDLYGQEYREIFKNDIR